MKYFFIALFFLSTLGFISCDTKDDEKYADYIVAKPLTISKEDFKNGVTVLPPKFIEESGKIYAYESFIFINDTYQGVHVIDNKDPKNPKRIAYIKIPGNVDISVKGNYLFADSLSDLVVIDFSNLANIHVVNRLEGVLRNNGVWPVADFYEYDDIDYENEIVLGWETVSEPRLISEYEERFSSGGEIFDMVSNNAAVGQGGSLARFKIVNDYLYAVDSHTINVFDISNLENPKDLEDVYAGFDIETIFNRNQYLFLGSKSGMYIYDISSPSTPQFVSEFQHGTACDPVVVDDKYAYVTLRGGNSCGATESGLFVIDIQDIKNPILLKSYAMEEPYGLGLKDNLLFVCDGKAGLKVYDKTDVENLEALNHFENIVTFDVIPLENSLLIVGDGFLYQYQYQERSIALLSTLSL
ncbi:LVIVD repeat-containing protein [Cellulophaga algicola DSM 14237]|uniref:LVIVD repeat-containing protein n=1 Tax=Cellulophaga algicola (strain DSM 14237 / IC166 / ACAM 630) TaxID=688270 RepID=E6X3R1_CELAD|nr:hypothetical protein [Cellulophaga algicola]ADV48214.1 LVIVD repeat-containing protein [Cellulophaga algicola DSM 14237]